MATKITINQEAIDLIVTQIENRTMEELKNLGDNGSLMIKKIAVDFLQEVQKNI